MHRLDLTSLTPIAEAHYTDLYGNAVKRFHEKYKDAGPEFFVNFNPVLGDPRDKTILGQQSDKRDTAMKRYQLGDISHADASSPLYKSPSSAHSDPVGTYAYPAEYLANHWFDVHYGKDMNFLRVIKAVTTGDRVLRLANMDREYFLKVMKKLNLEFSVKGDGMYYTRLPKDAIMIYEAIFESEAPSIPHFRVNSYGKTIFKLIQNDFAFETNTPDEDENEDEDGDTGYASGGSFKYEGYLKVNDGKVKELSAQKQNERARKAGFDLILDRAESPLEATIHPNEPEQAIFLTKRSYEVVETMKLPSRVGNETDGPAGVPDDANISAAVNKAAGTIAAALGDRVAGPAWRRGICPFKNLTMLRHWLATEKVTKVPTPSNDPTLDDRSQIHGWVTTKGRLIVVAPAVGGILAQDDIENTEAQQRNDDALEKIRVRPGEEKDYIRDDLKNRLGDGSMEKSLHRGKMDFNTLAFHVGVVGEWPDPVFVVSEYQDKIEDIAKVVKVEIAKPARFKTAKDMTADSLAAKPSFRRITAELLSQYERALRKGQKSEEFRPVSLRTLSKPQTDSAEDEDADAPESATPAEPDDSAEHPAP